MKPVIAVLIALTLSSPLMHGQGAVIVRVDDPSGSHCIDANSEDVTVHVRRIFVEKSGGLFTEDRRAGVVVSAKLVGRSKGSTVEVQIPSVNLINVQGDPNGRISLPLEYEIASYFTLKQQDTITTDIIIALSLAKTRGRNTFGDLLDLAGKTLSKISIPNNPFSTQAGKFINFANDAINGTTKEASTVPFAEIALSFNRGKETDLNKCKASGKERTGAIAVLRSGGRHGANSIPITNTDQLYCFNYSSTNTYELLAAPKPEGGCPANENAYQSVSNDYVMLLLSAHVNASGFAGNPEQDEQIEESRSRCKAMKLKPSACGVPE
jgi:hypothetical protein